MEMLWVLWEGKIYALLLLVNATVGSLLLYGFTATARGPFINAHTLSFPGCLVGPNTML